MKSRKSLLAYGILLILAIPHIGQPCTSFVIDGPVFGTNFDYGFGEGLLFTNKRGVEKASWTSGTTGQVAKWTSKYGSVTFNLVGRELAWSGMNEAGLVISTMSLDKTECPEPDARPSLPDAFWVQYQLDNCSRVEEVIASDPKVRYTGSDHYLVCDRTGNCATIEFIDGKMVWHTKQSMPVKTLTNNTYSESVRYFKAGKFDIPSREHSLNRFARAASRVRAYKPGSTPPVDYCFETLENVAFPPPSGPAEIRWPRGRSPRTLTRWSIVYDIPSRRVHFRTYTHKPIRHFDLNAFDFSGATPVLMLEANAKLASDIAKDFTEYSHDRNLKHVYRFCRLYGADMTFEAAARWVGYLEGFPRKK